MILLSFDVGRKKTGVAIGNVLTGQARPLTAVRGNRQTQIALIAKYIGEWRPHKLLVGLPRHMDGKEHAMTRFCRHFAADLQQQFNLPTEFVDERQSTLIARAVATAKDDTDCIAASVILQDWLRNYAASSSAQSSAQLSAQSSANSPPPFSPDKPDVLIV